MNKPPLILIVDDDANFIEIAAVQLAKAGFAVDYAMSAAQSYEKARLLSPDLVLMDINMTGVPGVQAVMVLYRLAGYFDKATEIDNIADKVKSILFPSVPESNLIKDIPANINKK